MINLYDNVRDADGTRTRGRTMLFVDSHDVDGNITGYSYGHSIIPENSGNLFIIDDWVVSQIEKLSCADGRLNVKEGEELVAPVKTATGIERERLLAELAKLDGE